MKILVADDNPVFQKVLKTILTNWGYEVVEACNGSQAWSLLQADGGPRLAILDWMMPGLEGVDVCRHVRASSSSNDIYILILTAKTRSEDLRVAIEAGSDDYVTKPFNSQELRVRLRAGRRIVELQEQLQAARKGTLDAPSVTGSFATLADASLVWEHGSGEAFV